MASVSVRKLRKDYGKLRILHDVDVDVADGEFVVLVGPSGCGKSTLLRSIAGLESIDGGSIQIGGRQVADMPAKDRDVAMVFQNYALYPHMTVAENMGFSMRLKKISADRIQSEVGRAASILGLDHLLARYPRQLSGGQRQRVAMGRAIVRDPQVFLFDEPLSNLDAKLRVQMRSEIKKLQRTLCATVIYVTHDQAEAMTMADRIVVMRDGVVEQQGAPLALFDRPESPFVAGFIGSPAMNLLPCSISGGATPAFETASGTRLPIPDGFSGSHGAVVVGVRPECINLASEGVPARIELVEPMGSESIVVLDAGGTELHLLLRSRQILRPGEAVHLSFERDALHVFDGASGRRLN